MPDDAGFINQKGCAASNAEKAENAISLANRLLRITEKRKCDADFLGEGGIGCGLVDTDSEDLRFRFLKLGETSLVRLEFVASGRRVGENVESQNDVIPPVKIAQPGRLSRVVRELEIGRSVANL